MLDGEGGVSPVWGVRAKGIGYSDVVETSRGCQYDRISTKPSMILTGSGMWNFSYERPFGTLTTCRMRQKVVDVI